MTRQIVLDTETTGLSPKNGDRIIEIGCVELVNRKLTGNNFHEYINPDKEISQGAYKVHGISNKFLADKPRFAQISSKLMSYLEGAELIIHNASFDVGFLEFEFSLIDSPWEELEQFCSVTDTLMMARKKHPGQKNNLDALCKRYHIDNTHRDLHGALLDSEILAEVYLAMTGGQTSMKFDPEKKQEKKGVVKLSKIDLPVLQANAQELKQHEAYLDALEAKGQCQWRSMSANSDVE